MELIAPYGEANGRHAATIEQREYRTDIIRCGYKASAIMINYLINLSTGGGKSSIIAAILYEFLFKENEYVGDTYFHQLLNTRMADKLFVRALEECEGNLATILNQLDHSGRSVLAKAIDNCVSDSVLYSIRQAGGTEIRSSRRDVLILGHTHVIKTQNKSTIQRYFDTSCRDEVEFCSDVKKYAAYRSDQRNTKPCIVFAMNTVGAEACEASLLELNPSRFRAIVVDEAHHCPADMYLKIFAHFGIGSIVDDVWENNRESPIWVLGATATKQRADNKCYYGSAEYLFPQVSPPQYTFDYLLENKYLSPIRSVSFDDIASESAVVNSVNHVIKCNMAESSGYSHVLTFATYRTDARAIKERFDMVAKHLGCKFVTKILVGDNAADTERICDEFKRGVIQNIVSVGMLLEGLNVPIADTIVLLRDSSSERVILQSIGRGTRLYPGKKCVQVIDPYFNVGKLKLDNVESKVFRTCTSTDSGMEVSDCDDLDLGVYLTPGLYEAGENFRCGDEQATGLPCEEMAVVRVAVASATRPVSYTLEPTTETWTGGIKRICDSTDDREVKRICENPTWTISDSGKLEFEADCTALRVLDLDDTSVSDISALGNCTSLAELHLNGTNVTDISVLEKCKLLTKLYCWNTGVQDISALGKCTELTELELAETKVTDISVLANCPALTKLYCFKTGVQDISALADCSALTELGIGQTKVTDISVLANCPALTKLYCFKTGVQDISALADCPALTELGIGQTKVTDISVLANCPALTKLGFYGTKVSDISVLANCPALTKLHCWKTGIRDISVLDKCTALTKLIFTETKVSDISVLVNCPALTVLGFGETKVSDISVLANCPALTKLHCWKTGIRDISVLDKCTALTELDFSETKVSDISVLDKCTALTKLYCWNTGVQDIGALAKCPALTELYVDRTKVSDISVLAACIELRVLDFPNNVSIRGLQELLNCTKLENVLGKKVSNIQRWVKNAVKQNKKRKQ